jgi:hypothetical protein
MRVSALGNDLVLDQRTELAACGVLISSWPLIVAKTITLSLARSASC